MMRQFAIAAGLSLGACYAFWLGVFTVGHGVINPAVMQPRALAGLLLFLLLVTGYWWFVWMPGIVIFWFVARRIALTRRTLAMIVGAAFIIGAVAHACCIPDSAFRL